MKQVAVSAVTIALPTDETGRGPGFNNAVWFSHSAPLPAFFEPPAAFDASRDACQTTTADPSPTGTAGIAFFQ